MDTIIQSIDTLLYADVIDNTFGVMISLEQDLKALKGKTKSLSVGQQKTLLEKLLCLTSESIRGALHWHELRITNSVISAKNVLILELGGAIPEDHQCINPAAYTNRW